MDSKVIFSSCLCSTMAFPYWAKRCFPNHFQTLPALVNVWNKCQAKSWTNTLWLDNILSCCCLWHEQNYKRKRSWCLVSSCAAPRIWGTLPSLSSLYRPLDVKMLKGALDRPWGGKASFWIFHRRPFLSFNSSLMEQLTFWMKKIDRWLVIIVFVGWLSVMQACSCPPIPWQTWCQKSGSLSAKSEIVWIRLKGMVLFRIDWFCLTTQPSLNQVSKNSQDPQFEVSESGMGILDHGFFQVAQIVSGSSSFTPWYMKQPSLLRWESRKNWPIRPFILESLAMLLLHCCRFRGLGQLGNQMHLAFTATPLVTVIGGP